MKGGNYSMKTVADFNSKSCFERENLRKREREARAQMTFEADQRLSQDVTNSAPLFGEIVRVNPKPNDKERQQIERKLGRFEDVKHLLADQDVTNLFGVDGQPPPSPAPNVSSSSSSIVSHEFKKPNACLQTQPTKSSHHHHHHHHHSSNAQRNTFVKPNDGKSTYASRGSLYGGPTSKHCNVPPTLSVKTGANLSAANSSSYGVGGGNSTTTANYHYGGSTSNKASTSTHDYAVRIQQSAAKNLPKINCELRDSARGSDCCDDSASVSLTNVENILDEMTSGLRTPLTAIAATPRKEVESKFTFNSYTGKVESLLPLPRTSVDKAYKTNASNNVSGPAAARGTSISSAFRGDRSDESTNVAQQFSTTSLSAAGGANAVSRSGTGYAYPIPVSEIASSFAGKEEHESTTLPCLKADLSLSEDTDDGVENENDEDDDDDDDDDDEDDDDDDEDDDDDDDEEDEKRSRRQRARCDVSDEKDIKYKTMSGTAFATKKESSTPTPPTMTDNLGKFEAVTASEVGNTSSSDDSDSDSASESEDSSSDSPSPPSLPLPVVTEQEESKHRWNLKNFLPPSAHDSQNCEKLKTDDSDSSTGSGARRKDGLTSCSTSDSDNEGDKSRASSRRLAVDGIKACSNVGAGKSSSGNNNASLASTTTVASGCNAATVAGGPNDDGTRSKYSLGSSSCSQSSDDDDDGDGEEENEVDSDRVSRYATSNTIRNGGGNVNGTAVLSGGNATTTMSGGNGSVCATSAGCGNMMAANSSNCAGNFASNVTSAANNNGCGGGVTVVGVVRPHQRKPPSPQIFHHNGRGRNAVGGDGGLRDLSPADANEDHYTTTFVPQRALHLGGGGGASEPQCDLSAGRAESGMILKNVNRALINDHYQQPARNNNKCSSAANGGSSSSSNNNNNNNGVGGPNLSANTGPSNNANNNNGSSGNKNNNDDDADYDDRVRVNALGTNSKSTLSTSKANASSKARRKSKSSASACNDSPVKKKRGRKRTIKVPDLSDSDEDAPKTKAAPEKKRPGRPPLKRNDTAAAAEDLDWNSSSRRKMTDKFASSAANVWCDRERRRSSLRMSSFTTVDSDSEMEILTATVKPTARVMPAVKRKDGGGGSVRMKRDSSCESIKNVGDFNVISEGIKSSGGGGGMVKSQESPPKLDVECIAVQDKKKSDTLRKLFSRREEGGGKTGGKGKGGKGKCGVIVMESEVERKLLQRSSAVSPTSLTTTTTTTSAAAATSSPPSSASNLSKIQDRVPDMSHVAISSPNLQSNDGDDRRYLEMSRISSAANRSHVSAGKSADSMNSGGGGGCGGGVELVPKLTYNEAGRPSLMCKIDLSKIPYILAKKRSEEIRIKCELSDTRQSSSNAMLDSGGVKVASAAVAATSAPVSSADAVNVPSVEPLSDRRRNNGGNGATISGGVGNANVNAAAATAERGDLSSSLHSRKKHSSKKTKNSKRKHLANEPQAGAVTLSPTPPAPESVSVEEDENASIFATASTVHTPSVDTADMDSSLSSDSEARKQSVAAASVMTGFAPRSDSKSKKRTTTATPTTTTTTTTTTPPPPPNSGSLASATVSDSARNNLITSCYAIGLNDVQRQNVNNVGDQSSADDESWNNSSESSCDSNCSASSTPRHGDDGGAGDKYFKIGKRTSQYRTCGKKTKKKIRNENSQRQSALSDCGVGNAAANLIHIPNAGHERSSISADSSTAFNGYHQVAISDLVRPTVPSHHGIYYSYLEHKASEENNSESDNVSPNLYLMEAKRLKHAADTERDSVAQGMQYLEAILSFVLTGHVLERKNQMDTAFNMYSETLKLIVYISKKFRTLCTNVTPSGIPNKIAILSLRCESILNLKLYTMRENEVKDVHNTVAEYFSKPVAVEACLISNAAGIPSPHSPTPSPASSIGSNSSGYSSGERVPQGIAVPLHLHVALQKQHNFYSNLIASFSYWEEADKLIFSGGNKDFFIELDRFCGPLTLHSSLKDLVHYVRVGIQRLKAIISHNHGV